MDQVSNLLNGVVNLMEKDIRGVHIGCYSIAFVGLTIALRKVKPFSKFKRPSDIPNHFIKEKRELTGFVKRIEPNGALLMIQHKPLVNIPLIPSGQLPVKISGVNVTGLGLNWLQAILVGSEVKFVPVIKANDFVQCEVLLVQPSKDKKQQYIINVGENLVKIGFGLPENIEKTLEENPQLVSYYKRLKIAEKYAIRKKLGFKYYIKPTKEILLALLKGVNNVLVRTTKQAIKLPYKLPKLYAA